MNPVGVVTFEWFCRPKERATGWGQLRALASGRFLEDNDCRSAAEIGGADLYQDISGLSNSYPVERYQLHKSMQSNRLA